MKDLETELLPYRRSSESNKSRIFFDLYTLPDVYWSFKPYSFEDKATVSSFAFVLRLKDKIAITLESNDFPT
jgi:hypothetical protein